MGSSARSKPGERLTRYHGWKFRGASLRLGAEPGSVHLVPQSELRATIEADYGSMRDMILGDAPNFGWIMDQLQDAEATINGP